MEFAGKTKVMNRPVKIGRTESSVLKRDGQQGGSGDARLGITQVRIGIVNWEG